VDSSTTFDTFYTTDTAAAIDALKGDQGYLFIAASFRGLKKNGKNAVDVYTLRHTPTQTHYYTTSAAERDQLLSSGTYTGGDVGFRALAPGAGSTDFVRMFNSSTGAYGFTSSPRDVEFFRNQGYELNGVGWSV
jgi:hypothetical protein